MICAYVMKSEWLQVIFSLAWERAVGHDKDSGPIISLNDESVESLLCWYHISVIKYLFFHVTWQIIKCLLLFLVTCSQVFVVSVWLCSHQVFVFHVTLRSPVSFLTQSTSTHSVCHSNQISACSPKRSDHIVPKLYSFFQDGISWKTFLITHDAHGVGSGCMLPIKTTFVAHRLGTGCSFDVMPKVTKSFWSACSS